MFRIILSKVLSLKNKYEQLDIISTDLSCNLLFNVTVELLLCIAVIESMRSLSLSMKGSGGIGYLAAFFGNTSIFWLQVLALSRIFPIH